MTIRGRIDEVRNNSIVGWAAAVDERSGGYGVVAVEAMLAAKPVRRARADRFRADLKRDGIGSGGHGFEIQLPSTFRHGGPLPVTVRAIGLGPPVELGTVMVFHGEASESFDRPELQSPPGDAGLDVVLGYIRSVSHSVLLAHAKEVQAELGNAAVVAYLFGRLLERMPDREAYETYHAALNLGALDPRGLLADIVQSSEYRSRDAQPVVDRRVGEAELPASPPK